MLHEVTNNVVVNFLKIHNIMFIGKRHIGQPFAVSVMVSASVEQKHECPTARSVPLSATMPKHGSSRHTLQVSVASYGSDDFDGSCVSSTGHHRLILQVAAHQCA